MAQPRVRVNRQAVDQLARHPRVVEAVRDVADRMVEHAQRTARAEAYDSGAYHDSIHTEPDKGATDRGLVLVVAGGAVQPRFAPRAGTWRGPDVDYAWAIELAGTGARGGAGKHLMRRAAESAARGR